MEAIALTTAVEINVEDRAEQAAPAQVVRELSALELALVGGGTANVVFA